MKVVGDKLVADVRRTRFSGVQTVIAHVEISCFDSSKPPWKDGITNITLRDAQPLPRNCISAAGHQLGAVRYPSSLSVDPRSATKSRRSMSPPCRRGLHPTTPLAQSHVVHHNKIWRPMSESGLVSRVSLVQTALRNCTRDEGRSFEVGKPPQAAVVKSNGGERCGNVGTRFRQVRLREASASEPL
jgi:hypothetical protein